MTTMDPITIRLEPTALVRHCCFFCGCASNKEPVQPKVYSGEDDNGVLCPDCLKATPTEFVARIRRRAEELRRGVTVLLELANNPPNRPTIQAFNAAVAAAERDL